MAFLSCKAKDSISILGLMLCWSWSYPLKTLIIKGFLISVCLIKKPGNEAKTKYWIFNQTLWLHNMILLSVYFILKTWLTHLKQDICFTEINWNIRVCSEYFQNNLSHTSNHPDMFSKKYYLNRKLLLGASYYSKVTGLSPITLL